MKLVAIFVIFAAVGYNVNCGPCHHGITCLAPPPKVCVSPVLPAPPVPQVYLPETCFNAKHALYKRYPLLYKIYLRRAARVVKKLDGVVPCAPAPAVLPVAAPASVAPELLNTLLAYSAASVPAPVTACV